MLVEEVVTVEETPDILTGAGFGEDLLAPDILTGEGGGPVLLGR